MKGVSKKLKRAEKWDITSQKGRIKPSTVPVTQTPEEKGETKAASKKQAIWSSGKRTAVLSRGQLGKAANTVLEAVEEASSVVESGEKGIAQWWVTISREKVLFKT